MTSAYPLPQRPVRILMYTAYFEPEYSGAALQALTLARELRRRGHHIEFVTNRWPGLEDAAVVDGFAVRRLEPGRMRKHREFRLWFNLARYCYARRHDFDVLHSHGAYFTNAFIGPLARLLGLKSLIKASLANDDLRGLSHSVVGRLHRSMLGHIDTHVAISLDLADEFRAGGLPAHRVHHVPNGVDTTRFHPVAPAERARLLADLNLPSDVPIALFAGVLDERKNILWLAERWCAEDAFGTGGLLVAVGPRSRDDCDGALRRRLAALAAANPRRFTLRDFCIDLTPYFGAASVLLLPSAKEGLPNVVLEAMACGLPCVAAAASGTRELIIDGVTGLTYPPDDVRALGSAVRKVLGACGTAMGRAARTLAEQRYAIGHVAGRYEALYAALMSPPRRVLYVENGIGYGGAIICLRHLVRNLDRNRWEPMVVTGLGGAQYQEIAEESRWKHIPDRRLDTVGAKRQLANARWPDVLPGLRWLANQVLARADDLGNFLPSFLQTLWTVLRFRPALIHVNNEPLCNRAAVLAGKLAGVPVIAHVRGDQQGSPLMRSFFRMPDQFIAVSHWVSESIGRLGVSERRRCHVYDGIELDKLDLAADGLAFRRRHGIAADAYAVGLVGMLIPWKGQHLFLDAVERVSKRMPDAVFAIVGAAPEECRHFEVELRERAAGAHFSGRVVFTGHVSGMAEVYNGLDIVLSASTSPEPLGTMIIESMTMARPLLAPAHGGAVEMIEDGRTGLLFTPNDADDLATCMLRLYEDREFGRILGAAAREEALRRFAIDEHVRRVEEVYARLIGTTLHTEQQR